MMSVVCQARVRRADGGAMGILGGFHLGVAAPTAGGKNSPRARKNRP
jgi:hypothetical protein